VGKRPGPLNRRLMGPRAGPEEVSEKKISSSVQDMNPVLSNA
jgi:hypothetical protein